MKKYIIPSAVALAAIATASAETAAVTSVTAVQAKPGMAMQVRPVGAEPMMPPVITTGDPTTDAAIKVLQKEMEAKIKTIRDEYQVKIKTAIGDRKVITRDGNMMYMGSTTRPTPEKNGEHRMGSSTAPVRPNMMMRGEGRMMASTTQGEGKSGMVRRDRENRPNGIPTDKRVEGESIGGEGEQGGQPPMNEGSFRGFFNKLFGR